MSDDSAFFNEGKELKQRILEGLKLEEISKSNMKSNSEDGMSFNPYLDEALLPDFDQEMYDDEYDDTYDEGNDFEYYLHIKIICKLLYIPKPVSILY